jgi:hypothetical protein
MAYEAQTLTRTPRHDTDTPISIMYKIYDTDTATYMIKFDFIYQFNIKKK